MTSSKVSGGWGDPVGNTRPGKEGGWGGSCLLPSPQPNFTPVRPVGTTIPSVQAFLGRVSGWSTFYVSVRFLEEHRG